MAQQLGMHLYSPAFDGQAQLTYEREYIDTFGQTADCAEPGPFVFTTATALGAGPIPNLVVDGTFAGGAYTGWVARPEPYNAFVNSPWLIVNSGALGEVAFSPNDADSSGITFPFTLAIFPPVLNCDDHKIAKFRMFGRDSLDAPLTSGITLCDVDVWVAVPGQLPPDVNPWAVHESFSNVQNNVTYDISVPDNARLYFQFKNIQTAINLDTLTLTAWVERGGIQAVTG